MALATNRTRGTRSHTGARRVSEADSESVYERPAGAALTGLMAVIVGAWGAVAGYVGPYFGFRPVAHATWVTNLDNGLLHLAPGAVAAGAGLMLMAFGPARRSVRGGGLMLPALLLLAAGAWFVIGPVAWPTFESGPAFTPLLSPTRNLLDVAGASYAPGLVLVMLGGMALKAGLVRSVPVADPMTPSTAVERGPAVDDRGSARGSARDSARSSARDSALGSEPGSARDSARGPEPTETD
jgi:hypothetical protein